MTTQADQAMMQERFRGALAREQPLCSLRDEVRMALAQGQDREVVLAGLERLRQALDEVGQAEQEDVVLDVMDFLVGWCSPHMKL